MIKFDTRWLAPICYLSSDRLLAVKISHCFEKRHLLDDAIKKNIERAFYDHQPYLKSHLRKEDIPLACEEWLDEKKNFNTEHLLITLHRYFLTWCGNCYEVKAEVLEEWLSLISILDPAWIIGIGYVDLLKQKILDVEQLLTTLAHQCPSALPKRFDGKDIADNHVHLNGNGHASLSLFDFALYLTNKPNLEASKWPYRPESSFFNSDKLDITKLPIIFNRTFSSIAEDLKQEHCKQHCEQKNASELLDWLQNWEQVDFRNFDTNLLTILEIQPATTKSQKLLAQAYLADIKDACRWLVLSISLLLKRAEDCEQFTIKTDIFINLSHLLRNYMIMSGVGLGHFVSYFRFDFRIPTSLKYQPHALFHDIDNQTHREFRVSSNVVINHEKLRLEPKTLSEFAKNLHAKQLDLRSHFIIHFTRSFPSDALKTDRLQQAFREKLRTEVRLIQQFFSSATYSSAIINQYELASLSSNKNFVDLRALIRGFDIAGNENELPIEIFAPTLRVLRSSIYRSQSAYGSRLRQPFLTIHAGEDFSHLLSGLRSIDEAVEFCHFKSGDRLGHALALGVDVYQWAQRQQRCYIKVTEHVDNLVWLYFQGTELIQQLPDFHATLCVIENKIQRWFSYIYQEETTPPLNDLYKAWKLRRNSPLMLQQLPSQTVKTEWELWAPDTEYLNNHSQSKAVELWYRYLHEGSIDMANSRKYNVISINFCGQQPSSNFEESLTESVTKTELKLIHAVQDLLIERYSKRQIIIEACPTSNIFIGRFEQYYEHPIFRLNPPISVWLEDGEKFNQFGIRHGSMTVCVNTDDAGLMPTTIENEHRVLKEVAIKHYAVSSHDADLWIDNIRQKGVDIFKSNHLNWVSDNQLL